MPRGEYLQYGGQAIVEGVMMRSPRFFSIACRAPNGEIVVQTEPIAKTWIGRQRWLKPPFLRGTLALLDAMALGSRAMRFATGVQLNPKYAPIGEDAPAPAETMEMPSQRVQDIAVGGTMVFAIAMGLFIFAYVPNLIAEFSQRRLGITNGLRINLVAEAIKILIFIGYVGAIGFNRDIHRVFEYHGAEHKAINTLEAEEKLDLEHCEQQTRFHPRCGTSFAMIVLLLGLLVFTFVPRYPITGHQGRPLIDVSVRVLIEIAILPFIAGVAYELLRLAGKFRNQTFVNLLFKPGIWTQYLTTREPDPTQIEVSLTALQAVLAAEEKGFVAEAPSASVTEKNLAAQS